MDDDAAQDDDGADEEVEEENDVNEVCFFTSYSQRKPRTMNRMSRFLKLLKTSPQRQRNLTSALRQAT